MCVCGISRTEYAAAPRAVAHTTHLPFQEWCSADRQMTGGPSRRPRPSRTTGAENARPGASRLDQASPGSAASSGRLGVWKASQCPRAFSRLGVSMSQCLRASRSPASRCLGVPMSRCLGVQPNRCPNRLGVPMSHCQTRPSASDQRSSRLFNK
jgi:hypothetical protein